MQLGEQSAGERTERSRLDVVLDKLNHVYGELVDTMESGGLDQLSAAEKISWWREFETFRNRLPLIDHSLIADAEASDLAVLRLRSDRGCRSWIHWPGTAAAASQTQTATPPKSKMHAPPGNACTMGLMKPAAGC
jgi:hypothetical protein